MIKTIDKELRGIIKHNSLQPDTKLYRYISLSQFLSWMETKQTYLTRICKWEDPWEIPVWKTFSAWFDEDSEELSFKYLSYPPEPTNYGIAFANLFGQCWTTKPDSDAMWRIYSHNNEGLMIKTSVEKFDFIKGLASGLISPVIYGSRVFGSIIDDLPGPMHPFLHWESFAFNKRNAFEHEQEVRLVALSPWSFDTPPGKDDTYKLLPLNPVDFIEGITIDPRASSWYVDTIKRYCERYGLNITPEKSNLYESPQ